MTTPKRPYAEIDTKENWTHRRLLELYQCLLQTLRQNGQCVVNDNRYCYFPGASKGVLGAEVKHRQPCPCLHRPTAILGAMVDDWT